MHIQVTEYRVLQDWVYGYLIMRRAVHTTGMLALRTKDGSLCSRGGVWRPPLPLSAS